MCKNRDCDRVFETSAAVPGPPRRRRDEALVGGGRKAGVVDWPAVQAQLREQGVVLVGGGADEAPEVYKRLPGGACRPR